MEWKIAILKEFSVWLQGLPSTTRIPLGKALQAIRKETAGPWEVETEGIRISRLPGESPALYEMVVVRLTPKTGVLYGLVQHWIVPGAWGELPDPIPPDMIKKAQEVIQAFKESDHGKT